MMLMEFVISICAIAFFLPVMLLLWIKLTSLPSRAPLLLAFSFMLIGSVYFGGALASFVLEPTSKSLLASRLFSMSTSLSIMGLMLFTHALLIPEYSTNLNSYLQVIIITVMYTFAATYLAFNITLIPRNNVIQVQYDLVGTIGLLSSLSILTTIAIRRLRKIKKILSTKTPEPFKTVPYQVIFTLTIIIQFLVLTLSRVFPSSRIPAFTWFLPSIVTVVLLGWAVYQHPVFLLVCSHRLEAAFIIDKKTGLVIFSETSDLKAKTVEDVLSSLLKGLDFSLKRFLNTQQPLEKIMFGDKVLIFGEGKFVIALMVLTSDNLIARDVCKHLARTFEEKFDVDLKREAALDLNRFASFSDVLEEVRAFFVP